MGAFLEYRLLVVVSLLASTIQAQEPSSPLEDRVAGLLYGAAIGDALGGPVEFQSREDVARLPQPPKLWRPGEKWDDEAKRAAQERLILRPYAPLRPQSASYGQWGDPAPAGTITDDTRHKLVLLEALHQTNGGPLNAQGLARAYLQWPSHPLHPEWTTLRDDWLEEWHFASHWVLGNRDPSVARPPERLWQGLPTCCGQMTSLPLAALFPGEPEAAYRACYQLSYFDNSWGKDLNAALVAGLAIALTLPKEHPDKWGFIRKAMLETDPYLYGDIRFTRRQVDRWLDLAMNLAANADGEPAKLFAALEETFAKTIKWEAQVPFVVAFSCLALSEDAPLAALQLSIEWGHDTDSYAALVGSFIGALHGAQIFPQRLRQPLDERLLADFQIDLQKEAAWLISSLSKAPGP